MGLFKSSAEKELDAMISRLDMNLSHAYKDNAQADLKSLDERYDEMRRYGLLKNSAVIKYADIIDSYTVKVKALEGSNRGMVGRWR